jgi:hypothetical protein
MPITEALEMHEPDSAGKKDGIVAYRSTTRVP